METKKQKTKPPKQESKEKITPKQKREQTKTKVKKVIKEVKGKKKKKDKVLKATAEVLKTLPEKKIKKGFFHLTTEGALGASTNKTKLEKKGRKLELSSGKSSVSKNGDKYELKHGPYSVTKEGDKYEFKRGQHSVTKEGKNISATTGGKNWSANVNKGKGGYDAYVGFTKAFKKGGLVSKRTFIARGCGKVMNKRRKKTKIY